MPFSRIRNKVVKFPIPYVIIWVAPLPRAASSSEGREKNIFTVSPKPDASAGGVRLRDIIEAAARWFAHDHAEDNGRQQAGSAKDHEGVAPAEGCRNGRAKSNAQRCADGRPEVVDA